MSTSEIDQQLHAAVMKREEPKEKAFREERARREEEFHNSLGIGGTEMTKKELRKIIDNDRRMYYRTEELNDKLYIHYKGWREIQSLEGWTGLKTLYAECNAFSLISGLENCTKLRSLFLQENCITKISGLESLPDLWSINLSNNFIERIEGLEGCKGLNTLMIAKNKIGFGGVRDVEKLADTGIFSVDIQDNRIDDPDVLPEVFARMRDLRVLYFKGNAAGRKIVNYRKSTTVYCKELRYLDDRPIFEDDRRNAEAFNRGGIEEQRAEGKRIREEKNEKHDRNMRHFQEMIENSRREKKERDAMRAEDKFTDETDPVESFERRCKRLQNAWQEDNKEGLKDEAQEYAAKCLKAEREGQAAEAENADDEQKATTESRDTAAESGDTGAAEAGETGEEPKVVEVVDNRKLIYEDIWDGQSSGAQPTETEKKQEDNRKLVYEDIWGDAPAASASSAPATGPTTAGPPTSLGPQGGQGGIFMPWAEGAVGMDAMDPSPEVLEKRKADLRNNAPEVQADNAGKPSWHSKYLEQVAKTQAKLEAAAPVHGALFRPPPRRTEPAPSPEPEAEKPETKVAADSPPQGAGELDEMD